MSQSSGNGITGAVGVNLPIYMTIVAFSTIALYNVIELSVIIFATFKRRKGLYFWSFIVATWGIVPHTVGFILKFFAVTLVWWPPVLIVGVGWFAMVTGQSMVLYSRLHLVAQNEKLLRWVLYLIIFDAIVVGIPDMTLAFLTNRPDADPFIVNFFSTYDKVQVGIFFVQELIISGLYIYETVRLLGPPGGQNPFGKLLRYTILVNVLVLVMDITLLGTEYSGYYEIQTTYKPAIYSIKLKMEFSILNRLTKIVKNRGFALSSGNPRMSLPMNTFPTDTLGSVVPSDSMFGSVKDDERARVKMTEIFREPANGIEQLRERDTVGSRDSESSIRRCDGGWDARSASSFQE
jgi:hypothetical protein